MNRRRGLSAAAAVLVLGVALIVYGEAMYQTAAAQAARINSECPYGMSCTIAVANPALLDIVGLGVLIAVIGTGLAIYVVESTRRKRTALG